MTDVLFISDLHLGHKNICKYRTSFSTTEEHDECVVDGVMSKAHKRNHLWLLGDCFFTRDSLEYLRLFKNSYSTVRLILGNHCTDTPERQNNAIQMVKDGLVDGLYSLVKYKEFWLSHAPIHPDELRGKKNIHGHCVDDKTEILTSDGWKKYNEVTIGQSLPTINEQGLWEEDTIQGYILNKEYRDKAYKFKGKGIDMLVSDKHRVYFLKKGGTAAYLPADKAFERYGLTVVKAAYPANSKECTLSLDMIRLYVWMVADGFITPQDLFRVNVKKARKVARIEALLNTLNIDHTKNPQNDGGFCFNFKRPAELHDWNIKGLDRKVLGFSHEQVIALRDEYSYTDGNRNLIFTSKKCEADLLQELFVKNGFSAKLHTRSGHGFSKGESYQLSVTPNTTQGLIKVKERAQKIDYCGIMWCVVTGNGNFIARREGSVFVTGNCHFHNIADSRYLNVSCENVDYVPINLKEVRQRFNDLL